MRTSSTASLLGLGLSIFLGLAALGAAPPAWQEQRRTLDAPEQLARSLIPHRPQDAHVVLAAQAVRQLKFGPRRSKSLATWAAGMFGSCSNSRM